MSTPKKCRKCGALAQWFYMPAFERDEKDRYECDNCISRGCSCNRIKQDEPYDEKQYRDKKGRQLPCIEWEYNADGWDDDGRIINKKWRVIAHPPFNTIDNDEWIILGFYNWWLVAWWVCFWFVRNNDLAAVEIQRHKRKEKQ